MTFILILLAIPGVLAVLVRLTISLIAATKHTVERYVAKQIKDQRAERGDLSGLAEAERVRAEAARKQMRWVFHSLGWITLLAFPLMIPGAVIVYPLYSLLWLLPRRAVTQSPSRQ